MSLRNCRLLFTFTFLPLCLPAVAQQTPLSAPLTAGEIVSRVVAMNDSRAKALYSYSSFRSYHLQCHCMVSKTADMIVRADYNQPNKKQFAIVSESGSGTIRNRVFRRLLEAEVESMQEENQQRSAITPENYTFRLVNHQRTDKDEFYVLEAEPRNKNRFLFRGRIWVDAKAFVITRVEGEPAVNPSWWTPQTHFTRTYQKVGDFWLPESNESVTKVRVFGTAVLTITYRDYQITRTPILTLVSSERP
jgi:outer membrane lipoprotein-sorting protein